MDKQNIQKKNGVLLIAQMILLSMLVLSVQLFAESNSIEYKIKAGYLYNFTKFITWPEDHSATFDLCIVGNDPFGSIIDPIEKRTVKNKPIHLFRLQITDDLKHCHLVYFSNAKKPKELPGILTISSYDKILTVGDNKDFVHNRGMIGFFLKEGKVKLHINLAVLRQSGLEVSAKLLEISEVYEGGPND